jgi:hypothetical protein
MVRRHADVAAHGVMQQHIRVPRERCFHQALHRRANAIDNRRHVLRLLGRRALQLFQRRLHRAALRVTKHHHQALAKACGAKLDAAHL